jgi:hypothetical protein
MSTLSLANPILPDPRAESATHAIVDWVDRELGEVYGRQCGKGGDVLLELRRLFGERSLNRLIFRFYALLPKLQKHHYLLGFRIHTLLSSQYQIKVSDPLERSPATSHPLPLKTHALTARNLLLAGGH